MCRGSCLGGAICASGACSNVFEAASDSRTQSPAAAVPLYKNVSAESVRQVRACLEDMGKPRVNFWVCGDQGDGVPIGLPVEPVSGESTSQGG